MRYQLPRIIRIVFGVLGISSIALEIITLSSENVFHAVNFFSFLTVISNILASSYLIYFGITNNYSVPSQVFRGVVTLYMLMTGVIFALLLSGLENVRLTAVPWNNTVLHYIMPIVVVLDWLLLPPKKPLKRSVILLWITVPVIYVVYTMIRGAFVNWYPYPFLNPSNSSLMQVVLTCIVIAVIVVIAACLLRGVTVRGTKTSR
jgi:hypothetical protein